MCVLKALSVIYDGAFLKKIVNYLQKISVIDVRQRLNSLMTEFPIK